jgi:hypothetical protein
MKPDAFAALSSLAIVMSSPPGDGLQLYDPYLAFAPLDLKIMLVAGITTARPMVTCPEVELSAVQSEAVVERGDFSGSQIHRRH